MKIKVRIKGETPLLCNKFTDEAAIKATNGTRVAQVGEPEHPRQQAEKKLYYSIKDGKTPIIPSSNLLRSIMEGGRFFKNGKSKVTTQKRSLIPSCVWFEEDELLIKSKEPWDVDTRPVRIPSTGGRILAHRPKFQDWELEGTLVLDEEIMSESLLRQIVDAAGKRIGLGDYRPDCKGPFGRFVVTLWEVKG